MKLKKTFDTKLTTCLFCNSNNINFFDIDYNNITIDKCNNCGIKFMNPQYTDNYLEEYYSNYVEIDEANNDNSWKEALLEGHNFYISLIEKYMKPGNFLSVGCGGAVELEAALKRGWKVEGYDVDLKTTEKLSEILDIKIFSGDFLSVDFNNKLYDCIYLHQVLEHPKNPQEYLKKIHKLLNKNGILFIASPNVSSLTNIYKTFLGKIKFKKNRGKHYDTWHHIIYYTPWVLKNILEKYFNFKVLKIRNGYHVRPYQSNFKRFLMKNITEIFPWKSTFLLIAQKK
ncbi:MAG TPA: class I SAM-dependent methyltransferase [bacterium]|nr:class I SAM-dependent methyltransferase [bacterium]HOL48666.1 class I SAM-dependent methyltransferase [bacterium]